MSFDFNFVSAEFNKFVDTEFYDSSVFSITGPDSTTTDVLTTVNLAGIAGNTDCSSIAALLSNPTADEFAGQTDYINRTVDVSILGNPLFIMFTMTNVADTFISTILAINDIRF